MGKKKGTKAPQPVYPRRLMNAKVKEVMNRKPRTVCPETSIDDLLERMSKQIEPCFPVVGKGKRLLGIVTESDVLHVLCPLVTQTMIGHAAMRGIIKSIASTVGEIMTKYPVTVTPEMTIAEALDLMVKHKLRRLPVVEDKQIVGLLSLSDIIKLYQDFK
ncbi:MAG: hypothetical protein COT21_03355 [Hadesarchaea archaeon CG08_land_8_20_14_0_20_51_8]|nr:MAG: hypothetical protein COT21_03355 [Hadesarchaea archaeon CG08_land_8_20_14_0_20_51_8]